MWGHTCAFWPIRCFACSLKELVCFMVIGLFSLKAV